MGIFSSSQWKCSEFSIFVSLTMSFWRPSGQSKKFGVFSEISWWISGIFHASFEIFNLIGNRFSYVLRIDFLMFYENFNIKFQNTPNGGHPLLSWVVSSLSFLANFLSVESRNSRNPRLPRLILILTIP